MNKYNEEYINMFNITRSEIFYRMMSLVNKFKRTRNYNKIYIICKPSIYLFISDRCIYNAFDDTITIGDVQLIITKNLPDDIDYFVTSDLSFRDCCNDLIERLDNFRNKGNLYE